MGKKLRRFDHTDRQAGRKTLQLCRQVERSLCYALGSVGGDVLGGLLVMSVDPAPDASHLLVSVSISDDDVQPEEALQHLGSALPRLRQEVARDIHRRRVPELGFRCISNN